MLSKISNNKLDHLPEMVEEKWEADILKKKKQMM